VVLYELLSGHAAFDGESIGEIFGAILHTDPRPLRSHRPELPEGLETAVMRCIRRATAERFPNVAELAAAIEPFGSGAYGEYTARIARTLARATRVSDPGQSGRPPAVRVAGSTVPPPMVYTPVPPEPSPRSTHVRSRDIHTSETLPDASGTQGVPVQTPPRRKGAAVGAVLALVVLAGAAALVRTGPRWSAPAATAAPMTATPDTSEPLEAIWPAPAPPASVAPAIEPADTALAPQPSASAPAALASTSRQPVKRATPSRHGTTGVPSKPRFGDLPSVLDSPD
jgi:serine/threonine-protein kinase